MFLSYAFFFFFFFLVWTYMALALMKRKNGYAMPMHIVKWR